jgi:hypothetical protein
MFILERYDQLKSIIQEFLRRPERFAAKNFAPNSTATTKVTFTPRTNGEKIGLTITGLNYIYISVEKKTECSFVSQTIVKDAAAFLFRIGFELSEQNFQFV